MTRIEYSDLYIFLFDKKLGACVKLDEVQLNDDCIKKHLKLIDELWSVSGNIRGDIEMVEINEKFIEWGCRFVSRLVMGDVFVDEADRILDYMSSLYDHLPISSSIISKSLFNKDDLIQLFAKFLQNGHTSPKRFIDIFTKIWTFCRKEIVHEQLFCSIMVTTCEIIRDKRFDNELMNLFEYSGFILKLYIDCIGQKLNSALIISKCVNIVQVVVRSEKHAIARLIFWWQLICSVRKETLQMMIEKCLIPFLSNLFGKYMTLDQNQKFGYSLSGYNCFTNRKELAPLCNFVMGRILQGIVGIAVPGLPKVTIRYDPLDMDLFKDNYSIEIFIEPFLVAFYHWCQFSEKINKEMPFNLLKIVFNAFANRFLSSCDYKLNDLQVKKVPEMLNPLLYVIIENCITLKNLLEKSMSGRRCDTIFWEHTSLLTSIINTLGVIGVNSYFIPRGRDVLNALLFENLSLMGHMMVKPNDKCALIVSNMCDQWLTNGKDLVDLLMPSICAIDQEFMKKEMGQIVTHWCSRLIRDHIKDEHVSNTSSSHETPAATKVGSTPIWIVNIQFWCLLSSRIFSEFIKDTFTLNCINECELFLPFVDHLRAPMLFLEQLDQYSLGRKDFSHLCDLHERLYHIFVIKAGFIPSISNDEWCGPLCALLARHMSQSPYNGQALLLNFTARFLRLVVHYCDPIEPDMTMMNHKKSPLWQIVKTLRAMLTKIDLSNIRVALKESGPGKRIFSAKELSERGNIVSLSVQLQSVGNGDMDFTLGLILSVTEKLLNKMVHSEVLTVMALKKLSPMFTQIATVVFKKTGSPAEKVTQRKSTLKPGKDALEVEKFYIFLLKHVRQTCTEENASSILKPIFCHLFSIENGSISSSAMWSIVDIWNDTIIKHDDRHSTEFTNEFIDNLTKTKLFIPKLKLPKLYRLHSDASIELNDEAILDLTDNNETSVCGSLLNKIYKENLAKKTISPAASATKTQRGRQPVKRPTPMSRRSSDADYTVILSPPNKRLRLTDHQKEIFSEQRDKYIPTMYNDSDITPKVNLISQESASTIIIEDNEDNSSNSTISAENSKWSNVPIVSPNKFNDEIISKTTTTPMIMLEETLTNITEGISMKSVDVNISKITSEDQGDISKNIQTIMDDQNITMIMDDANPPVITDSENTLMITNIDNTPMITYDENTPMITYDENTPMITYDENTPMIIGEENIPEDTPVRTNEGIIGHPTQMIMDEKNVTPETAVITCEEKIMNSNIVSSINDHVIQSKEDVLSKEDIMVVIPKLESMIMTKESLFSRAAEEAKRKPLIEKNPLTTTARSPQVTTRSYRMVQMALENQQKRKEEPTKSSLVCLSEGHPRTSGIMRHTWSECKKDVKVTFSEPLVHVASEEVLVRIEEGLVSNEGLQVRGEDNVTYMSPVFDRTQPKSVISFDIDDSFELDDPVTVQSPRSFSVTCSDQRSAEKVRQSLDELMDLSPIRLGNGQLRVNMETDSSVAEQANLEGVEAESLSGDLDPVVSVQPSMDQLSQSNTSPCSFEEALRIVKEGLKNGPPELFKKMALYLFND